MGDWVGLILLIVLLIIAIFLHQTLVNADWSMNRITGGSYKANSVIGNSVTFNDVKGNVEAKEELFDVVEYLKDPSKFVEQGIQVPRGVLLSGPPGCGKTILARALAGESKVPIYITSGSEFEEVYVGVGASRVRNLFEEARNNSPCVIFIDEIDTFGRKTANRSSNGCLNQILVEMDGFNKRDGIIVIAATNLVESLEPTLLRPGRFDRIVHLYNPDFKARLDLFRSFMSKKRFLNFQVDLSRISRATVGFSGADIQNVVDLACIRAIKESTVQIFTNKSPIGLVTSKHLDEALAIARHGKKNNGIIPSEAKLHMAVCQAAQALIALKTENFNQELKKVSIIPRNENRGNITLLPSEGDHFVTISNSRALLDFFLSPHAAEKLIFKPDKVSSLSAYQLDQATRLARKMITKEGGSQKFGFFVPNFEEGVSDKTLNFVDREAQNILNESSTRVSTLLQNNKKALHRLTQALLKYEELDADQVRRVIDGSTIIKELEV